MNVIQIRRGETEAHDDSGPGVERPVAGADGSPSRPAPDPLDSFIDACNWREYWRNVVRAERGDDYENSPNVYEA